MGDRIAQLRHKRGLSQAQLAKYLGLSPSTVAMYEQGRREPSISVLLALAAQLSVTVDYLLTGQTPSDQPDRLTETLLCAAWYIGK